MLHDWAVHRAGRRATQTTVFGHEQHDKRQSDNCIQTADQQIDVVFNIPCIEFIVKNHCFSRARVQIIVQVVFEQHYALHDHA